MTPIVVTIPGLRIESVANLREHWAKKAGRVKRQRSNVAVMLRSRWIEADMPLPLIVTMTRVAPRSLDSDNVVSSFKAVRDAVAEWLGIDDRSPLVEWRVTQERGAPRTYAVRIRIEAP